MDDETEDEGDMAAGTPKPAGDEADEEV